MPFQDYLRGFYDVVAPLLDALQHYIGTFISKVFKSLKTSHFLKNLAAPYKKDESGAIVFKWLGMVLPDSSNIAQEVCTVVNSDWQNSCSSVAHPGGVKQGRIQGYNLHNLG